MDYYLVDVLYQSEAFWGVTVGSCDIKPTDRYLDSIKVCILYLGHWKTNH